MNRHYNTDEYRAIVKNLRSAFPNAAMTTDIMVGFPGETDEEFQENLAFAKEIGFAKVHVFAYSRRPGTKASDAPNQLPNQVKEQRSREMIAVTKKTQHAFFQSQLTTVQPVLFEREIKPNHWEGYTPNYTPVLVESSENLAGKILPVLLTNIQDQRCIGKVSPEK